jgi:hypothetical protein
LPVSREYDTGEGPGEAPFGGACRFAGVEAPPFDDIVAADLGGVPAEFARNAAPVRPPLAGGGESVTAVYPHL